MFDDEISRSAGNNKVTCAVRFDQSLIDLLAGRAQRWPNAWAAIACARRFALRAHLHHTSGALARGHVLAGRRRGRLGRAVRSQLCDPSEDLVCAIAFPCHERLVPVAGLERSFRAAWRKVQAINPIENMVWKLD